MDDPEIGSAIDRRFQRLVPCIEITQAQEFPEPSSHIVETGSDKRVLQRIVRISFLMFQTRAFFFENLQHLC